MKKIVHYTCGIGRIGPTDCSLYLSDGDTTKEFGIDSESWKMVSSIMAALCAYRKLPPMPKAMMRFDSKDEVAAIARYLMKTDIPGDTLSSWDHLLP